MFYKESYSGVIFTFLINVKNWKVCSSCSLSVVTRGPSTSDAVYTVAVNFALMSKKIAGDEKASKAVKALVGAVTSANAIY